MAGWLCPLDPEVYEIARARAPNIDVYFLKRERCDSLPELPHSTEAAFQAFCHKEPKTGKLPHEQVIFYTRFIF